LDLLGDEARVAQDAPEDGFLHARPAARGWVFLTEDGALWTSERFVGRLRALAPGGCATLQRTLPASVGRVVVEDPGRGLLWSDGEVLRALDMAGATSLAWHGVSLGAAIVQHGALRVTTDGGTSWRAVDLGAEAPVMVGGVVSGLYAYTTAGWLRILPDGSLRAEAHAPEAETRFEDRDSLHEPAIERLRDARFEPVPVANSAVCEGIGRATLNWEGVFRMEHPHERSRGMWRVREPPMRLDPIGTASELTRFWAYEATGPLAVRADTADGWGGPVTFTWRARDALGAFSTRVRTVIPPSFGGFMPRLLVATRVGALVSTGRGRLAGSPPRPRTDLERALWWFTASGARRVGEAESIDGALAHGVALEDGGAVIVTRRHEEASDAEPPSSELTPPRLYVALRLSPTGAVLQRRLFGVRAYPAPDDSVLGLADQGGRWGVAMIYPAEAGLTIHELDGTVRTFGRRDVPVQGQICGATRGPLRIHMMLPEGEDADAFAGLPFLVDEHYRDNPPYREVRAVTLEFDSTGAPCVRGIRVARDVETRDPRTGESFENLSFLWCTARAGRLECAVDDGLRVGVTFANLRVLRDDDVEE